jgi:hypothetical protein
LGASVPSGDLLAIDLAPTENRKEDEHVEKAGQDGESARARPAPGRPGDHDREARPAHGAVRCKCTVEEGGIRYSGKVYTSLSGAAMAAAKDFDLKNKTQNGYIF